MQNKCVDFGNAICIDGQMRNHNQICFDIGEREAASLCGVTIYAVRSWRQRNRIPSEYWRRIVDAGHAEADELIDGVAA